MTIVTFLNGDNVDLPMQVLPLKMEDPLFWDTKGDVHVAPTSLEDSL